jgi:hypothetical protein
MSAIGWKAKLEPTPRWDRERALLHDFRGVLAELVAVAELGRSDLVARYSAEAVLMFTSKQCLK